MQANLHIMQNETLFSSRCKELADFLPALFQDTQEMSHFFTEDDLVVIEGLLLISHRTATATTAIILLIILTAAALLRCFLSCCGSFCDEKRRNCLNCCPRMQGFQAFHDTPNASLNGDQSQYVNHERHVNPSEMRQLLADHNTAQANLNRNHRDDMDIKMSRMMDQNNVQMTRMQDTLNYVLGRLDTQQTTHSEQQHSQQDDPDAIDLAEEAVANGFSNLTYATVHNKPGKSRKTDPFLNLDDTQSDNDVAQQQLLDQQANYQAALQGIQAKFGATIPRRKQKQDLGTFKQPKRIAPPVPGAPPQPPQTDQS